MSDLVTNACELVAELAEMQVEARSLLEQIANRQSVANANPEGHNQYTEHHGYFGDRKIGTEFHVHVGGNKWLHGKKVSHNEFQKTGGNKIGVSQWTKTKDVLHPTADVLLPGKGWSAPAGNTLRQAVRNDEGKYGGDAGGDVQWITVRGQHIPIPAGKDKGEAIKEHFDNLWAKGKVGGGEHGHGDAGAAHPFQGGASGTSSYGTAADGHGAGHGHAGHDPLEHAGHQAHAVQDLATIHDAFGGGHAAHEAIQAAHEAGEAAHAAHEVAGHAVGHGADLHGASPLDAVAIAARHLYGPMANAASSLMGKVPGLRRLGRAIKAVHEKATALNQRITEGLVNRYGKATAGAILGVGSAMSHTVSHGVGLHGPAASALPGPHLIGALPFVAAAEVGKRLGLVGEGTKLERGLGTVGAGLHGLMSAAGKGAGKVTGKVASTGLKGAHLAGRLTGKIIRGAKRLTGNELAELTMNGWVVIDADSLDVWNAASWNWVSVDQLAEAAQLTENELTDLLDFVVNAEPEEAEQSLQFAEMNLGTWSD